MKFKIDENLPIDAAAQGCGREGLRSLDGPPADSQRGEVGVQKLAFVAEKSILKADISAEILGFAPSAVWCPSPSRRYLAKSR